ncbi:hypothetical protein Tco_0488510 [Tanacetum coccineum]
MRLTNWSNDIGETCLTVKSARDSDRDRDSTKASTSTCKKPTIPTRLDIKARHLRKREGLSYLSAHRDEINALSRGVKTSWAHFPGDAIVSLGIVAGERIPDEASPAEIPQRHVAGEIIPATISRGERVRMTPWEDVNVCSVQIPNAHFSNNWLVSTTSGRILVSDYIEEKQVKM